MTAPPVGKVQQALVDTDGDAMDDNWASQYFGNLSQTATGDFDSDGMTNGEEYQYTFNPTVQDAFADADGDRYPNIFEIRKSADPNNSSSTPTPHFTVNASGGTYTNVNAALSAASTANGAYQIIGIAPGVYTGTTNTSLTFPTSKPKFLLIGLEGASKTIIDGGGTNTTAGSTRRGQAYEDVLAGSLRTKRVDRTDIAEASQRSRAQSPCEPRRKNPRSGAQVARRFGRGGRTQVAEGEKRRNLSAATNA